MAVDSIADGNCKPFAFAGGRIKFELENKVTRVDIDKNIINSHMKT